ncbi:efflux RND transporter periplasmic adaptor subunit [Planctobacterium marinum]|uniref:Membrane protein n=1 Tax=Planctobacterium marinum TaxID=1631968 RepID=A0AA48HUD4_9ALTE|nr:membrane protein [Planctobacterium marinum]
MKKKWLKGLLPFGVIAFGMAGMTAITATAQKAEEDAVVDTRPKVSVEAISAQNYQVVITAYGEVEPLESTSLSAQVSGEVVSWHPNFVPGGLIKRGETLFSIEKDTYQAALYSAQATLSQAKAALIEEQARADAAKEEAKQIPAARVTDLYLRKPQLLTAQANVKSAEAQLKIAQRDLDNCEVKAPYDALVVSRSLGVGQFVSTGAQVAQLYNVEYAEITLPIAGFDTAFLPDEVTGVRANVVSKGIQTIRRDGVIARDLGVVDTATRMGQVVARVADPYGLKTGAPKLKFGSFAEVNFIGKTLENVFKLPQELVTNQTVWVVDGEQKLEPRNVAVLREEGQFYLVSDGLQNNDRIVTTLPEYPQKGMEVKLEDGTEPTASL